MRGLPLLLILCACASAWSATVYKWVDDNGVTHYSDQPNPKAEKLQISGAQTYESRAATVAPPAPSVAPGSPAAPAVCVIDTPAAGQVLHDTFSLTGHVTLANSGDGSQATLRLDGQDISPLVGPNGAFEISQIDRGEHTLTLQVTDARGEVTCQATAVAFTVRQATALPPGTPGAPKAPGVPTAPGVGHH
jgi:hypothetical protein